MPPGVLCYPEEVSLPGVLGLRLDLALDSDSRVVEVDAALRPFRVRWCFIQFSVEERRGLGLSSTS